MADVVKNINEHYEYKQQVSPIILNDDMKKLIENGLIYVHGRDKSFRPIIVFQSGVFTDVGASLEDALLATYFVSWMLIDHLMIPGKIENWVLIDDLDNLSMFKLPNKFIKDFMESTQTHLKCRGRYFFGFNVTFGLRALWTMLSPFVDKTVKLKVVMTKESHHEKLDEIVHPSQLEQRYGGNAPNLETFWPPICPSNEYDHDPDLIGEQSAESQHLDVVKIKEKKSKKSKKSNEPITTNQIIVESAQGTDTKQPSEQPREMRKKPTQKADAEKHACCTIF